MSNGTGFASNGAHLLKENHFSPDNGKKKQIFSPNQCLLGTRGRLAPPPPILRMLDTKEDVVDLIQFISQLFLVHFAIVVQISKMHNLQFDNELNDVTTCRQIFYQESLQIKLPANSDSKCSSNL